MKKLILLAVLMLPTSALADVTIVGVGGSATLFGSCLTSRVGVNAGGPLLLVPDLYLAGCNVGPYRPVEKYRKVRKHRWVR